MAESAGIKLIRFAIPLGSPHSCILQYGQLVATEVEGFEPSRGFLPNWFSRTKRKVEDSNLRYPYGYTAFQVRRIRPLCQPSVLSGIAVCHYNLSFRSNSRQAGNKTCTFDHFGSRPTCLGRAATPPYAFGPVYTISKRTLSGDSNIT